MENKRGKINELSIYLRELEKKTQSNLKENRIKEIRKRRTNTKKRKIDTK